MTAQSVTSFYAIREHSRKLGPVPIIDRQKHGSVDFQMAPHGKVRYRERTTVERVYARLKVEFGGSTVRARPPEGATAAI